MPCPKHPPTPPRGTPHPPAFYIDVSQAQAVLGARVSQAQAVLGARLSVQSCSVSGQTEAFR